MSAVPVVWEHWHPSYDTSAVQQKSSQSLLFPPHVDVRFNNFHLINSNETLVSKINRKCSKFFTLFKNERMDVVWRNASERLFHALQIDFSCFVLSLGSIIALYN